MLRGALLLALAVAAPGLPPPRFVGPRLPGKERDEAWKRNGGTDEARKAIEAGLDWLDRHARPDGGWDADGFPDRCAEKGKRCDGIGKGQHGEEVPCPFDEAIAALGSMAFLGSGTPVSPFIEKTLRMLESAREPWSLALATEALAEAEVMEGKGRWSESIHRNVKSLLDARQKDGGWGYIAGMRKGSDVPYTVLVATALAAARDAGAAIPDDIGSNADRFLDSLEEKEGKLAYLLDGRQYGYTPTGYNAHAALAIREVLRAGTGGRRHAAHLAYVRGETPSWEVAVRDVTLAGQAPRKVRMGRFDLLHWEFGAVAMFQRGGSDWSSWYGAAKTALVGHQRKDGCAKGSWDPLGQYEMNVGGRVLATALGVLILEEPVRHRRP
jgi:hypothetical protein